MLILRVKFITLNIEKNTISFHHHLCMMIVFDESWDDQKRASLQTTVQGEFLHYTGHDEGQTCSDCLICSSDLNLFDPQCHDPYNSPCVICDVFNNNYSNMMGKGMMLFSHRLVSNKLLVEIMNRLKIDNRISKLLIFQLNLDEKAQSKYHRIIPISYEKMELEEFTKKLKIANILSDHLKIT